MGLQRKTIQRIHFQRQQLNGGKTQHLGAGPSIFRQQSAHRSFGSVVGNHGGIGFKVDPEKQQVVGKAFAGREGRA